jgi:SAM-dependent methyltransferase
MSDDHWQLEGGAAELYQRYLVPGITAKWVEDLVHRARLRERRGSAGRRLRHRRRCERWNAGCCPRCLEQGSVGQLDGGSALDLPFPSGHFDVVLCQLGLQFFPDQPRALREMLRVVREGGRVALSVYSPIERTGGERIGSRPATISVRVFLPLPFRPKTETTFPRGRSREKLS